MSGLFSTFNIAKRGMNVQQRNIEVTSHNINNTNTVGYSRQRAKVQATRAYSGAKEGQIGTGAQVAAIERVRDSFIDHQIRTESSVIGKYGIRNQYLFEVETIFNEPSEKGIASLMGKFFDSFQELSKKPESSNARTVAVEQTLALTDALNHTYTKLEELLGNSKEMLRSNVVSANSYLDQLDSLNKEIIAIENSGQTPNDLMDSRDLLIDEISYKFNIQVDVKNGQGITLKTGDKCGMKDNVLVSGNPSENGGRFSFVTGVERDKENPDVHLITYYKNGNTGNTENKQTIRISGLSDEEAKNIESTGVIFADSKGQAVKGDGYPIKNNELIHRDELKMFIPSTGEMAGNISIQEDVKRYMNELNSLAKTIAFSVNAVHSGQTSGIDKSGVLRDPVPLFLNGDVGRYNNRHEVTNIGEVLDGEKDITAKNITVNREILNDVMKLKTRTHDDDYSYAHENNEDGKTDGSRALAIASLRDSFLRVQEFGHTIKSREDLFDMSKGGARLSDNGMKISNASSATTMSSYFKDTIDRLGIHAKEAQRMVENQEHLLSSLEETRQSVSGVSLDEEMANLVQFQHAYTANAKIISTVDELLDIIVNGLVR